MNNSKHSVDSATVPATKAVACACGAKRAATEGVHLGNIGIAVKEGSSGMNSRRIQPDPWTCQCIRQMILNPSPSLTVTQVGNGTLIAVGEW